MERIDLNPCDFYLGENSKVFWIPTLHMTWKLGNSLFEKQFTTFSNANCNNFLEICLKEFRHVSQQRAGILIIFHDGEYVSGILFAIFD
jgi:hypothetical protein